MPIEAREASHHHMDRQAEHNDEYMAHVLIRVQILKGSHLLGAGRGEEENRTKLLTKFNFVIKTARQLNGSQLTDHLLVWLYILRSPWAI